MATKQWAVCVASTAVFTQQPNTEILVTLKSTFLDNERPRSYQQQNKLDKENGPHDHPRHNIWGDEDYFWLTRDEPETLAAMLCFFPDEDVLMA